MNIGIDARLLSDKITGISRFLMNVLEYIPPFDSINKYFLFTYKETKLSDNFYSHYLISKSKIPGQIREHLWLNFTLPKLLNEKKLHIFRGCKSDFKRNHEIE